MKKTGLLAVAAIVIAAVAAGWWGYSARQHGVTRTAVVNSVSDSESEKLNAFPSVRLLKEQEPTIWANVMAKTEQMRKEGKSDRQIYDAIQPDILHVQMVRLQQAPDKNVVEYMRANMEQTAAMQKISDDDCFRFLFPQIKGGVYAMNLLPRQVMAHRSEVDAAMMSAAVGPNKHTVTDAERQQAHRDVQQVIKVLNAKYGADMALLSQPQQAVGKEQVMCNMVQDLWDGVLALPEANAAAVIRLSVQP